MEIKLYRDRKSGEEMYILPDGTMLFGEIVDHYRGGNAYRIGTFLGEIRKVGKEHIHVFGEITKWLGFDFASKKRETINKVLSDLCEDFIVVEKGTLA